MPEGNHQKIPVRLDEFTEQIATLAAKKAAQEVVDRHIKTCPISKVEKKVERLEGLRFWLLGFVAGGSTIGGIVGALLTKLF